jgi:uncharacterized membrane protein YuzA (DUF378 family)
MSSFLTILSYIGIGLAGLVSIYIVARVVTRAVLRTIDEKRNER